METVWKKYFVRHGLFTYARDTLIFFINLFVWAQEKDLKAVALFNIIYLAAHTSVFLILLPALKRGMGQTIMKIGLLGFSAVLGVILLLGEQTIDFLYPIALSIGVFNGMYWFVNHVEGFDMSTNTSRASFLSYRMAIQGASKLAVPGIGWLMFSIFGNNNSGYTAVFIVALLSMFAAYFLVKVKSRKEPELDLRGSVREIRSTKYFGLLQLNGFLYGISIRSALAAVLLPLLIFQVVETESSLSMIQTLLQIIAIVAAAYFAGYKKNLSYITKLLLIGGAAAVIGLVSLLISLSFVTYLLYLISYVITLNAMNIGLGTLSNNYISTIKDYDKHRIEYIVVREYAALSGFIAGYVFVFFNPGLSTESLRPLLLVSLVAALLSVGISVYVWQHVQAHNDGNSDKI